MSRGDPDAYDWRAPRRQPEGFWAGTTAIVLAMVLVLMAGAGLTVFRYFVYLRQVREPHAAYLVPDILRAAEIGIVNQDMFVLDTRGYQMKSLKFARLYSYGWVEPAAGRIHIPITRAMELYLEDEDLRWRNKEPVP